MAAGGANEQTWMGIEEIDVPLPVPAGHAPLTMTFWRIPAGSFRMGARGGRAFEAGNEEPVHEVEVPDDFWMAKHVVTQHEYAAVFEALGLAGLERPDRQSWEAHPSHFKNKPDHPVENVSWIDATLWCQKLSAWWQANCPPELSAWCGGSRVVCSLPTEIEWEYACRAGTETEYWCGDDDEDLRRVAWFGEDDNKGSTHSVLDRVSRDGDVSMATNAFGLVGVHGNVLEWCRDAHESDAFAVHAAGRRAERQQDGADAISDDRSRVFRGGSWSLPAGWCRSAFRNWGRPGVRYGFRGFRVCLVRGPGSRSGGGEAAAPKRGATLVWSTEERRQALEAAAGRSPAAELWVPFSDPHGPPALVVGSLGEDQSCPFDSLDFSRFTSLRHLILWRLTDVVKITGLPAGLERLDVRGCTSLESLPTVTLDRLETLDLGGCTGLGKFPAGIQAPNLRWLYLDGCTRMQAAQATDALGDLLKTCERLEELSAVDCAWLERLRLPGQQTTPARPSIGDWHFPPYRLKKLVLNGCTQLQTLPDLSSHEYLHHLDLRRCKHLKELPAIPVGEEENRPTGIRTLYLTGCDELKTFRGLDVRRVHRGEAIPTAGSKAPAATDVAVNVASQFRTLSTLADEPAEMRMAKVLFLGSGRCGKTTIAKSLRWKMMTPKERSAAENSPLDPCPDGGQISTPDIRLDALDMPVAIGGDVVATRVHVWDFGGQEIYHNTHRLFASEGAVFVIVTTTPDEHRRRVEQDIERLQYDEPSAEAYRKENRYRELAYWLDYVWEARGLAGAALRKTSQGNPSVLVVVTGTPPTTPHGKDGTLDLLRGQAGRYRDLIGNEIPFKVAPVHRPDFDIPSAPIDGVCQWVGQHAADISDELGVRVPRVYAAMESRCTTILHDNQAIDDAIGRGETPATDKVERYTLREWTELVASSGPAIARSPRARDEIARAVAAYLHACGRVFFLPRADTVVVDQRWAVDLVYDMVVRSMAGGATRQAMHAKTSGPFAPAWFRSLFHNRTEIIRHWDFLLGLLDACNLVIKLPSGQMLAVHPELLAHLDRDAEDDLFRQWETTQPGSSQPALVNRSFAIHDTGNGLLLGRNAFQKIVATVGREMGGRLPRRLFLPYDEGEARDGIPRVHGFIPTFVGHQRFWRDGFQINWLFMKTADGGLSDPQGNPIADAESLALRMEWKNLSREGGFRGGIFVQMLCSDAEVKGERLLEFLFGRGEGATAEGRRSGFDVRESPPLAEYSRSGSNPDLVIHDVRSPDPSAADARSLRGIGRLGWRHPDGPTNNVRFDVAISYRRKASERFVKALHAALRADDILCYYDGEQRMEGPAPAVEGGQAANTLVEIYDTLRRARVLIVVPAVEYFALPTSAATAADNIFCPVELADAVISGTRPSTDELYRAPNRHLWVCPNAACRSRVPRWVQAVAALFGVTWSEHIGVDHLQNRIRKVLDAMMKRVIEPRVTREDENPAFDREYHSVSNARARSTLAHWSRLVTHGTDQYHVVPRRDGADADSWDFTAVIAAVRKALET